MHHMLELCPQRLRECDLLLCFLDQVFEKDDVVYAATALSKTLNEWREYIVLFCIPVEPFCDHFPIILVKHGKVTP